MTKVALCDHTRYMHQGWVTHGAEGSIHRIATDNGLTGVCSVWCT
jgi:hypothetical protein